MGKGLKLILVIGGGLVAVIIAALIAIAIVVWLFVEVRLASASSV